MDSVEGGQAGEESLDGRGGFGIVGAVDQDDRQGEGAGGGELGVGGEAAAVLGDEDLDPVAAEEGFFLGLDEGAAAGDDLGSGEGVRVGGLDAAEEVTVLGGGAEGGGLLAADGEEDAGRGGAEGLGGGGHVGDGGPAVAGLRGPGRAGKDEARRAGQTAGLGGVLRDLPGEGVGGVDEDVDAFGFEPAGEARRAAEAADAERGRLRAGVAGAAGQREGDAQAAAIGEAGGEVARFGGAAEDQDVAHAGI